MDDGTYFSLGFLKFSIEFQISTFFMREILFTSSKMSITITEIAVFSLAEYVHH